MTQDNMQIVSIERHEIINPDNIVYAASTPCCTFDRCGIRIKSRIKDEKSNTLLLNLSSG